MPRNISTKKAAVAKSTALAELDSKVFTLFYDVLMASEILPFAQTGKLVRGVSRWGRAVSEYVVADAQLEQATAPKAKRGRK